MWLSCAGILFVVTAFLMYCGHLDLFRAVFFTSPAWVTLAVGPWQKDRSPYKLIGFMIVTFLFYWSTVHCYPSQCRHAWGTMMVADLTYWDNQTAFKAALVKELDTYYLLKHVDPTSWSVPNKADGLGSAALPPAQRKANKDVSKLLAMLEAQDQTSHNGLKHVNQWIEPLTGGTSLDNLKLRAYCNIHRNDHKMPHVYPLKVLGVAPEQFNLTAPCPHWTCVLTESRQGGKLVFFEVVALAAILSYAHYRCDCWYCCVWLLGTGQCRIWWMWFWATLLPFLTVMLIKTTHDKELSVTLMMFFSGISNGVESWIVDNTTHQVMLLGGVIGAVVCYVYRDRVRKELGLDEATVLALFPRNTMKTEDSFQVCLWRVDISADRCFSMFHLIDGNTEDGQSSTADSVSARETNREETQSQRALMICGLNNEPSGMWGKALRAYLPLVNRRGDGDQLHTPSGSIPSLSTRLYHGSEEIQRSRTVRVSPTDWSDEGTVYFQEMFKLSVERRPSSNFRVEIRDSAAALGHVAIGHCTFSDDRLERQFERSRKAQRRIGVRTVAVEQVMQMMLEEPCVSIADEERQMRRMWEVGFAPHRLSEGGAVWLAFCDTDTHGNATCGMCSCV